MHQLEYKLNKQNLYACISLYILTPEYWEDRQTRSEGGSSMIGTAYLFKGRIGRTGKNAGLSVREVGVQ